MISSEIVKKNMATLSLSAVASGNAPFPNEVLNGRNGDFKDNVTGTNK